MCRVERCGRGAPSLGENQEGVGVDPVVLHRFGRGLGLHELLKRGKVGDLDDQPNALRALGVLNVRVVIPRGPNTSSRLGELSQWSTSSTSWNAR